MLGAMSVPWTASYRAEISADLPVSVLMTVEISLCCFGGSTARKFASVWQDMSINVTVEQCLSFRLLGALWTLILRCDKFWANEFVITILGPRCRRCICCSTLTLGRRRCESC